MHRLNWNFGKKTSATEKALGKCTICIGNLTKTILVEKNWWESAQFEPESIERMHGLNRKFDKKQMNYEY